METNRRSFLLGSAALLATAGGIALTAPAAQAAVDESLVKQAAAAGPINWYESSPPEQGAEIVAAFKKHYPDLDLRHVRVPGGNDLPARIIQESQASDGTADVASAGAGHIWELAKRDLARPLADAGVTLPADLTPVPFGMVTAASIYCLVWNTQAVPAGEEPKTWQDMLDPRWKDRCGTWVLAVAFTHLAKDWGYDKAKSYLEAFAAQKPLLYKSTFPLAQQVAAGEVDVAIGIYHTAQPPIDAGAPIKVKAFDPVPTSTIYSIIPTKARNPAGAAVLLHWLSTPEGALAYEAATSRGNPRIAETKTAQLLAGKDISEFPPDETDEYSRILKEFNQILADGAAR